MGRSADQRTGDRHISRWRSVAFVAGWLRQRYREWDRGTRNFTRGILVGSLLVAVVVAGFLFISRRQRGSEHGAFATVRLEFQPNVLMGAHGQLYVGGEAGVLATVDPDTGKVTQSVNVGHPVDHLAADGDAVLAAGDESLTRLTPGLTGARTVTLRDRGRQLDIQSLAAGVSGGWVIGDGGRELLHLSSSMLGIETATALPQAASTVAASNLGAWILPTAGHDLMFARPVSGGWRVSTVALGCHPTAIVAEHDHAYVVCGYARRLEIVTDTHLRILSSHRLGAQADAVGLGDNSEWVLESSADQVRQYAEATGREVGNPVGLGREADALAVYERSVWIAERDGTVTRIEIQGLAEARRAARTADLPFFGHGHVAAFELADLTLIVAALGLLLLTIRGANSPFPRYFPAHEVVMLAVNPALYEPVASSLVTGHVEKKSASASAGTTPGLHVVGGQEVDTYFGAEPIDAAVARTVRRLYNDGRLFTGAHFIPGYRHRGLRWRPAPEPSESVLLRAWQPVADEGALCLIAGQEWAIGTMHGSGLTLELDYVVDRIAGEWRRVTAPEKAQLWIFLDPDALSELGRSRLRAGTRIRMDVLAQALPYDGSEQPQLELIAAWQPVRRPTPVRAKRNRRLADG